MSGKRARFVDVNMDTGGFAMESRKFEFPFEPYEVQLSFMESLFDVLEKGKIGVFESPTGTGKSLSIICGALTWLKDFGERKARNLKEIVKSSESSDNQDDSDWFASFAKKQEQSQKQKEAQAELQFLEKVEKKFQDLKKTKGKKKLDNADRLFRELFKDNQVVASKIDDLENPYADLIEEEDDADILPDYKSDEETDAVMKDNEDDEDGDEQQLMKIFYCSRTHSQLSQFVKEIQKSPFVDKVRVVTLGSRQNLCINEVIKNLNNLNLMNEKCLDMQKAAKVVDDFLQPKKQKKGQKQAKCPFYKQHQIEDFKDNILTEVRDIEQAVSLGKETKSCPYYGSRYGTQEAELVVLPYNILLHKSTRDACKIKLKDNVVIIDEAHNLLETLSNMHSISISGCIIMQSYMQLNQYFNRYKSRLNPKNLMYVKQLLFIMTAFIKHLGGNTDGVADKFIKKSEEKMFLLQDFLIEAGVDNLNLFKIIKYCEKSQIAHKLHSFSGKTEVGMKENGGKLSPLTTFLASVENKSVQKTRQPSILSFVEKQEVEEPVISSPFVFVQGFLKALTNLCQDGRVLSVKGKDLRSSHLKFLLLNPCSHFKDIVAEARSVIVAGGTMQPVSEFIDQLFIPAGALPSRIETFSCGHVIPSENLLALALSHGPTGKVLDFTYQSREKKETVEELGRVILNFSKIIPGGLVCFFPSYEYEQFVYGVWEKSGLISQLSIKKKVFREPRKTKEVDIILREYGRCIEHTKNNSGVTGAVLFSVVGGKMSEGINFSDDLGRSVIMVGLPFPNVKSPEINEKMIYLNAHFPKDPKGRLPGQVFYENLCMKAVNQSIGRAIRHKNDFATIILLDERYQRPSISEALPGWIQSSLKNCEKFGQAFGYVRNFFAK